MVYLSYQFCKVVLLPILPKVIFACFVLFKIEQNKERIDVHVYSLVLIYHFRILVFLIFFSIFLLRNIVLKYK